MLCENDKITSTIHKVIHCLNMVMALPLDDLEKVMQQAHDSTAKQVFDPPDRFPISRQALRMLWHFRCNIEAVRVFTEDE